MQFQTPTDIVNRALQHIGAPQIYSLSDQSAGAFEMAFIYDKVRRAELRRNIWTFATREVALRALDTATQIVTFPAWVSTTTYGIGQIVTSGGLTWVSLASANTGNTPGVAPSNGVLLWDTYFGPCVADPWNFANTVNNFTGNISYHVGELVYLMYPSTNAGKVYTSLVKGNQQEPDDVDAWSSATMYQSGAVVSYSSTNYQSKINQNYNNEPDTVTAAWTSTITNPTVSGSWSQIASATLGLVPIVYPLTAGPVSDAATANAFKLPAGYLRRAPETPKAGITKYLGAPYGPYPHDWQIEGGYIVSSEMEPAIILRFVADVQDVTTFDDMFCEGLACRLALEAGPALTAGAGDWPARMANITAAYRAIMGEARTVDSIEAGPVEEEVDLLITCRL